MPRKKIRGRVTIIRDRCKGCGYCVEFCPMKALKMSREFNDKGYHFPEVADSQACTGCDLCGMFCPDFAISGCRIPTGAANEEPNKE
ncbi:MAG: 4Fe-4S binding protein [Phycisphaerae bacterium]|nr:4Fe-4S binding protein [Phycisphaerae bacterium]